MASNCEPVPQANQQPLQASFAGRPLKAILCQQVFASKSLQANKFQQARLLRPASLCKQVFANKSLQAGSSKQALASHPETFNGRPLQTDICAQAFASNQVHASKPVQADISVQAFASKQVLASKLTQAILFIKDFANSHRRYDGSRKRPELLFCQRSGADMPSTLGNGAGKHFPNKLR